MEQQTAAVERLRRARQINIDSFCGHPGCLQLHSWTVRIPQLISDPMALRDPTRLHLYYTRAGVSLDQIPIHSKQQTMAATATTNAAAAGAGDDYVLCIRIPHAPPPQHHASSALPPPPPVPPLLLLPSTLTDFLGIVMYQAAQPNAHPNLALEGRTLVVRAKLEAPLTPSAILDRMTLYTRHNPPGVPTFARLIIHPHDLLRSDRPTGVYTMDHEDPDFMRCTMPFIDVLNAENAQWIDAKPGSGMGDNSSEEGGGDHEVGGAKANEAHSEGKERIGDEDEKKEYDSQETQADDYTVGDEEADGHMMIPTSPSAGSPLLHSIAATVVCPSPPPPPPPSHHHHVPLYARRASAARELTPSYETQTVVSPPGSPRERPDGRTYRKAAAESLAALKLHAVRERIPHPLTPKENDPPYVPSSYFSEDDDEDDEDDDDDDFEPVLMAAGGGAPAAAQGAKEKSGRVRKERPGQDDDAEERRDANMGPKEPSGGENRNGEGGGGGQGNLQEENEGLKKRVRILEMRQESLRSMFVAQNNRIKELEEMIRGLANKNAAPAVV